MLIKKSALQTQHNFNISGGSERVKYFASLGVFTQDGLFKTFEENGNDKGFKYNRYNYRINMDINVTSTTSMQINLGGYLNDKQEPNYNNGTYTQLKYLFRDIYTAVPFAGAGIVDGKWVVSDTDLFSIGNYYDALNTYYGKGYNNRTQNTLNFDFQLDQKLDFLTKGLKVHVKGAYNHCLYDIWPDYNADWRMQYNMAHRGDVYPTHGMGPACQLLDIHRGDRMKYLVAMDSDPVSLPDYLDKHGRTEDAKNFQNGEVTLTLIRTEKGKTIQIEHNVASPRPYSRLYQLSGTQGFADKYPMEGYALESKNLPETITSGQTFTAHEYMPEAAKSRLMEQYKDPIIKDMEERAKEVGGHGGMDFIMDSRLIYCLHNGLPLDMDVYDLAEWCSLIPLTKLSIENGSVPVEVPDFTRGAWNKIQGYRHAFAQ